MEIKVIFSALFGLFLIFVFAADIEAATTTTTFNTTANVVDQCNTLTASDMAFGAYDPFSGTSLDSTNTVSVTCTTGTSWDVALNAGTTTGGTIALRKMTNGSETLDYNVYTNAGHTTIWGDGTSGSNTVTGTGTGAAQNSTAYGRVMVSQTGVSTGSYSDLITVTVTY